MRAPLFAVNYQRGQDIGPVALQCKHSLRMKSYTSSVQLRTTQNQLRPAPTPEFWAGDKKTRTSDIQINYQSIS
ncbi:uncharacterized [Tachysurus ichikawai]